MTEEDYFYQNFPLIRHLPAKELADYLTEVGDTEDASKIYDIIDEMEESDINISEKSFSDYFNVIFDRFDKVYLSNNYTIGFYPPSKDLDYLEIKIASIINADSSLKKINIKLSRLYIKEYPGGKSHTILIDFYTENNIIQINRKEKVHFHQTFTIQNEGSAPIDGIPIFNHLNLDENGITFKFTCINVKDEKDKQFLNSFGTSAMKAGLGLLSVFQPAIAIITEFVTNIGKIILNRSKNRRIQEFEFSLNFDNSSEGHKLSKGSYVIVQIPEDRIWDWSEWIYVPSLKRVLRRSSYPDLKEIIPFNYLILTIS